MLFLKIDDELEIGFTTKALLNRLLNNGDIAHQQVRSFHRAVRAYHSRTLEYALFNLPRNEELLINAKVINFDSRRYKETSVDQFRYFIER